MSETTELFVAILATLALAIALYQLRAKRRALHGALYGFIGTLIILAIRAESWTDVNMIWLAKAAASGALWAFTGWFLERHKSASVHRNLTVR